MVSLFDLVLYIMNVVHVVYSTVKFVCLLYAVHRIGRTGRSGKTGLATTFINKGNEESVLLDLKHLLIEAKQQVPYFLATLQSENEKYLDLGGNILWHLFIMIIFEILQKYLFSFK